MNQNIHLKFLIFLLVIFTPGDILSQSQKLKIVATTGMIGDLVKAVAKEHAEVKVMMGYGVDPHLYKPTRSDMVLLGHADLVFYNGLKLEGKLEDALDRLKVSGRHVVAVTDGIDRRSLLEPVNFSGHYDPHVWMDPNLWEQALEFVDKTLASFQPDLSEEFKENKNQYLLELHKLEQYTQNSLATLLPDSKVLVTAHDAFAYFGKRYQLEVEGIQGISTESEAGIRDIERLVNLLVSRKVKAVFVESTISEKGIKALVEGAARQGHKVSIGGVLFSDAMGEVDSYEGSYIGMIDSNVTTIVHALGGKVPERGMSGSLSISHRD